MPNTLDNILWTTTPGLTPYEVAIQDMAAHTGAIIKHEAPERIWCLEHPHTYTIGRSGTISDVKNIEDTPLHHTDRGGKVTYHGPGQRIIYTMIDLRHRRQDVRHYVHEMEHWIIDTLKHLGVTSYTDPARIGLWVTHNGLEKKIGAIGLKAKKWVTFHGCALNINPDLSCFDKIVPCGIKNYGVTSLAEMGINETLDGIDSILKQTAPRFIQRISHV